MKARVSRERVSPEARRAERRIRSSGAWRTVGLAMLATGLLTCETQQCDLTRMWCSPIFSDGSFLDVSPPDAAVPLLDGGSLVLPIYDDGLAQPIACGNSIPVGALFYNERTDICKQGDWLYSSLGGRLSRTNQVTRQLQIIGFLQGQTTGIEGAVGCLPEGVLVGADDPIHHTSSLAYFTEITQPGVVSWWQSNLAPPGSPVGSSGGFFSMTTNDRFVAFAYQAPGGAQELYVADTHGQHVRQILLPAAIIPAYPLADLHASGSRLEFSNAYEVYVWNYDTGTLENVTNNARDQYESWIDGDRVVWVDQRDSPTGNIWSMNNPEIYAMDLRTHVTTRLTHDPPDHPVMQRLPVVSGDWVIWMDYRNATTPNPAEYTERDRVELWGYNFSTGREYPIVTGNVSTLSPVVLDGELYFQCFTTTAPITELLFRQPLPTP